MVYTLEAGAMKMAEVLQIYRMNGFEEFKVFLQILEVYGSGYKEDIDTKKYNLRKDQTHAQAMSEQLQYVILTYDLVLNQL